MIDLEVSLPHSAITAAIDVLFSCGEAMAPRHYSNDEDGNRAKISGPDEVREILGQKEAIFLWSPGCNYEVDVSSEGVLNVFGYSENAAGIDAVFSYLSELPVFFGYACAHEERVHRNRIERKMDYGVHEAWVGRDFSLYLPGVYWLTVFPVEMQRRLDISIDSLRLVAFEISLVRNRNWLIRLYKSPEKWHLKAKIIDQWCIDSPGCFSKAGAEKSLGHANNFIEASAFLKEWR